MSSFCELQRSNVIRVAHFHRSLAFGANVQFGEALAQARLPQPDALLALAFARDSASP
jgi:hypothetical protein